MVFKAFSGRGRTNFSLEITVWLILIIFGARQVGNRCWRPSFRPTSIERSVCVRCDLPGSRGGQPGHRQRASQLLGNAKNPSAILSWAGVVSAALPGSLRWAEVFGGYPDAAPCCHSPTASGSQADAELWSGTATALAGYGHLQNCFRPVPHLVTPVGVQNPCVLSVCCRIVLEVFQLSFSMQIVCQRESWRNTGTYWAPDFLCPILPALSFSHYVVCQSFFKKTHF